MSTYIFRARVISNKNAVRHLIGTPTGAVPISVPSQVSIVSDGVGCFLLFREDDKGVATTDTWHETVEDAKEQAELEYELGPWQGGQS